MTRTLAVLAFLLIAFAFAELWLIYTKLAKLQRRFDRVVNTVARLSPSVVVYDGATTYSDILADVPTPKRKPAAKRRRKHV